MKITFVSPSLGCGGAERCLVLLTRGLLKQGHEVTVITVYGKHSDFFELPQGAKRIALGIDKVSPTALKGLWNNLGRLRILRRAINSIQPDIVISHLHRTNVLTILAVGRAPFPVLIVEHNDPVMNTSGRIWNTLRRRTYPKAQKLISVSQGVDSHFSWLPPSQRTVIPNPLELSESDRASPDVATVAEPRRKWISAMGRLTAQKGFDLLLSAFASVASQHADWGLMIIGEGELRRELEDLSKKLGVSESVIFTGLLSNPFPTLRSSSLFVMASRFEGFPYAALEAMACGLPIIYTDCPSGPREIIREGIDGLLVPNGNVGALATAMDRLMSDENERQRLAERAAEVLQRFGTEKVIVQWEALCKSILEHKR